MTTFIVILGPPGVGKGTQAIILSERTGLAHISSGELFRENIKNQTELGMLAQTFMSRGELVPDDVTIGMIRKRLSRPDCKIGAILDGFPRTPAQADALDAMLAEFDGQVDVVPFIMGNDDVLVDIFNQKFSPPKEPGICDLDGSELYQRDDDKPETVKRRIQVYLEQTAQLLSYYRDNGKLVEIDGMHSIEQVTQTMVVALKK
jgi:adenylate kinase